MNYFVADNGVCAPPAAADSVKYEFGDFLVPGGDDASHSGPSIDAELCQTTEADGIDISLSNQLNEGSLVANNNVSSGGSSNGSNAIVDAPVPTQSIVVVKHNAAAVSGSAIYRAVQLNENCELLIPITLSHTPNAMNGGSSELYCKITEDGTDCSPRENTLTDQHMLLTSATSVRNRISAGGNIGTKQVSPWRHAAVHPVGCNDDTELAKNGHKKSFICTFGDCQWSFATSSRLRRHMESHLTPKMFTCETCRKQFKTIYNLRTHQKLHCIRPPEICAEPDCGAKFRTRRLLVEHMHKCHSPLKPYRCAHPGCQRAFSSRCNLSSHSRTHRRAANGSCDAPLLFCAFPGCGRQFDHVCRLQQHARSHTGERPYTCPEPGCTWAFTTSSKLCRHLQRHTGQRRWHCTHDGCTKAFFRPEHLRGHLTTHTTNHERTSTVKGSRMQTKRNKKKGLKIPDKWHMSTAGAIKTEMVLCETVANDDTSLPVSAANHSGETSDDTELVMGAARTDFRSSELARLRATKRKAALLLDDVLTLSHDYTQVSSSVMMSSSQDMSGENPVLSDDIITFEDPVAGCFNVETHLLQDDMPPDDISYINGDDDSFYLKNDDDVFYAGTTINLHDLE